MHKNTTRDLEPCIVITVERKYVMMYWLKLLEDKYVRTLHHLLKDTLQPGMRKVQKFDQANQVTTVYA